MVLGGDAGEVFEPHVALHHQALGTEREVGRRGREPRLLAPRLEERRADDTARHLLHAEHEHRVVPAARHLCGAESQGRAAARAAGLDVHGRHTREAERRQHLVAGRDAAVDGAAERGLEVAAPESCLGERGPDGVRAECRHAPIREAAEGVDPDPGDVDGSHTSSGRKA